MLIKSCARITLQEALYKNVSLMEALWKIYAKIDGSLMED